MLLAHLGSPSFGTFFTFIYLQYSDLFFFLLVWNIGLGFKYIYIYSRFICIFIDTMKLLLFLERVWSVNVMGNPIIWFWHQSLSKTIYHRYDMMILSFLYMNLSLQHMSHYFIVFTLIYKIKIKIVMHRHFYRFTILIS